MRVRCATLQDDQAGMMNRNALHALMGLEATPIKAGGFKYIHRDTGLIFEIAPATPDSAGEKASAQVTKAEAIFMLLSSRTWELGVTDSHSTSRAAHSLSCNHCASCMAGLLMGFDSHSAINNRGDKFAALSCCHVLFKVICMHCMS